MSSTSSIDSGISAEDQCSSPVFSAGTTNSSSPSPSPSSSSSSSSTFDSFSSEFSFHGNNQISDSDFEFSNNCMTTASEPPVSPKLICPVLVNFPPQPPVTAVRPTAVNLPQPPVKTVAPSVRQLLAEENGLHEDGDYDFYSAPSTPRGTTSSVDVDFGVAPAEILTNYYRETDLHPEERGIKGKKASGQSSSSSNKKWAFKDLFRRTVPTSKLDSPARSSLSRGGSGLSVASM